MKVNCPYHKDDTASMHIYPDGRAYCFGCGKSINSDELLGKDIYKYAKKSGFKNTYKEDITKSLNCISKHPVKEIRGLQLPCDIAGYYIVYPNAPYYIKRVWDDKDKNRYRSPKGIVKPIYKVRQVKPSEFLLLIEGQLNALTADSCFRQLNTSIGSPGAASDFNRVATIEYCLQYSKVCLIVDKDAAGVAAGIQLKQTIEKLGKRCVLYAMERDLNEILCTDGQEEVNKEIHKALDLFNL